MKKKTAKKKPARAKTPRAARLLNRKELAVKCGVVSTTITKWEQSGLPCEVPGRPGTPSLFDYTAVKNWRREREKAARENGTLDLTKERARKERAQALVAEQTLAVRAKDLIPVVEVVEAWSKEVAAVRAKLLSWPATLSEQLARAYETADAGRGARAIEDALQSAVEETLAELSEAKTKPKRKPARKKKRATKKKPARKKARKVTSK